MPFRKRYWAEHPKNTVRRRWVRPISEEPKISIAGLKTWQSWFCLIRHRRMESFWRRATPYSFAQKALSIACTKNLVVPRPKWSPTGRAHGTSNLGGTHRSTSAYAKSPTLQSYGDGAASADTLSAFIVRRQSPAMDDGVHGQSPRLSAKVGKSEFSADTQKKTGQK